METPNQSLQQTDPSQQQQQTDPNQQQQQQQAPPDPFASIPLDNLDDATRKAFEGVKAEFLKVQKTNTDQAATLKKAEALVSNFQSQAAKAAAKLQQHGLSLDGSSPTQKSPEEIMEAKIEARFAKIGLEATQAKTFAKIFREGTEELRANILQEVGGPVGEMHRNVQTMQSDNLLQAASQDPNLLGLLKVPGVYQGAKETLQSMINANMRLTPESVASAIQMGFGQIAAKGGITGLTNLLSGGQQQQQIPPPVPSWLQIMSGGSNGNGGYVAPNFTGRTNGGIPAAVNAETQAAVDACTALMDRQTKKVK